MTKEEAIKELELIAKVTMWNDRRLAVEMAIEALSADAKGDLISRADAIKAVEQEYKIDRGYMADDYTYGFNQAIQYVSDIILRDLPSAEAVPVIRYPQVDGITPTVIADRPSGEWSIEGGITNERK